MRALSFAFVALVCSGCAEVSPLVSFQPPPPDPRSQLPALETRITELIVDERSKLDPGVQALAVDGELVKVARERSADMAAKNYVANKSPDGTTSASLLMSEDADFQGLLGENIAAERFSPAAPIDVNAMAQQFVDTWMASPAHKENLSFKFYQRTGVGAAVGNGTVYVTELFSNDLGLKPPPKTDAPDADGGAPAVAAPDTTPPDSTTPAAPAPPKPDPNDKRTVTELPHPAADDAKAPAPPYTPPLQPPITQ